MARRADQAGYDAVWVGDSIVAKPRLEAVTTLAYLAGITTRTRLGTAVLLPALRHPVVLAHQLANVDQISRGRVVLGLGVGWSLPSAEREWAACGADHKRRVRRLEEHVQLWRTLWRGDPVTYQGDGVDRRPLRGPRQRPDRVSVYTTVRLDDDPRTAARVTEEFLATYYGGGVHSRGTMGLGPADVVRRRSAATRRPGSPISASGSSATISSRSSSGSPPTCCPLSATDGG